ncbi:uncharacterized protein L3040_000390 [Drepanopeziza brunnea f. sp. 'multigermtubi']|uniref:Uncharacterized protein n=1 Tax=Marssonina brunnea f. sp. multigermtubi (strain MB_m1) TaxID=1072389 RepID=K1XWG8_MARBU|nr:putative Protein FAM86A [Drepanopeziza brunnea f. sp. 'multigermtubi' MB_m1]EKD17084.1 putative Protein FAM86A [Drepanopeziza brunnea f. sp. 'multigermtubi' MB_m1]KAJ5054107.1 hypothetical protein L3040_000390 [Drepanopeziza brunnea f. sp. 'multigermtubi']
MELPITAKAGQQQRQLDRFCRQYIQVTLELDYPAEEYLRLDAIQQSIFRRCFSEDVEYTPPPRYKLRVLKELVKRIETSIQDWDEEAISDDLMNCLTPLLSMSMPNEATAAQQKSHVTYTLSLLPRQQDISPSITLHEARNMLAAAGTTGLRTWEAGLHLGNYLCTNPHLVRGKSILELGSGTGFLSILCAKYLKPSHVLATDGDDDVVASFSTNFYLNGLQDSSDLNGRALKWGHPVTGGEDPHWDPERPVDLVLGADLTYDPRNIPPLVSTFRDLFALYPDAKILIAATVRSQETFAKFPEACRKNDFGFEDIEFGMLKSEDQEGPFYSDLAHVQLCVITRT